MKKFILISLIAMGFVLGSCKKILDTKPQDFVTPETYFTKEADAVAALGSAWDMLTRQWMYAGYYQFRMMTSDDCWTALSAAFAANLGLKAGDATAYPLRWNQVYQCIEYCNILLDNLPRVNMDEGKRKILRGEGLFLRAFMYYELVKDWGPVPVRLTPTAGPTDVNIPNTPMKDIYALVIKDMTEAEGLVPTTATAGYGAAGYAAKTTIEAMLARVCLSAAGFPINDVSKYADAKAWAQKVVDSKEHALNPDYTQVFKNLAGNVIDKKESLWEVDFNVVTGSTEHGYLGYLDGISGSAISFGQSVGQYKVTRKLFAAYGGTAASTKDQRRDWNIAPWTWKNSTTTGADADKTYFPATQFYQRFEAKYRLQYSGITFTAAGQSPINAPLMRYSDVLLMLAEAENYLNGPTALAYSCVNQVRERAWGKMQAGATNITEADLPAGLSKDDFLKAIQNERLCEFPGEALRKQDLIRWGIFLEAIRGLFPDVLLPDSGVPVSNSGGQPYENMRQLSQTVSERDYLWPMPASEMQYNKVLKQNPGW